MKKVLTCSLVVLLSYVFISCGNSQNGTNTEQNDSIPADSLSLEDEQWEDHYAIWQMDSTNEVNFTNYELAAMEVRGHVKKIMWDESGCVALFDKDGRLTSYSDEYSEFQLGHNDDGCLTIYACGAGSSTYSIDPETNLLVCYNGGEGATCWTNFYHYDKDGNLLEIECNDEDLAEETKETVTLKVKVLEKDAHGNWTKRKVGEDVEKRTIVYYMNALEDSDDDSEPDDFRPFTQGYSFVGTIGGDENCVLTFVKGEGTCDIGVGQRLVSVDTYNPSTGQFSLTSWMKSKGTYIGTFEGTFSNGIYSGVFTNIKGAKVNFKLKMKK